MSLWFFGRKEGRRRPLYSIGQYLPGMIGLLVLSIIALMQILRFFREIFQ